MTTLKYWQNFAVKLVIEGRAWLVDGYQPAQSGLTFDCVSAINGHVLCQISACDQADAEIAVVSARLVFEKGDWSQSAPVERKKKLLHLADLIMKNAEELALLESLDMGKPIMDALTVDIPGASRAIRWHAEAIDKVYGEIAPTVHHELGLVTREPIGVVAAIVPWNFPLLMACWKIGPALASGNSLILKPSEKSSLTAIRLAALVQEAGIPTGVFQVLTGEGQKVGKALALHHDVDALVFTGSTSVAKELMVYAGQSNMKRVWLEAGGKSPNVVFEDAPDLDKAAKVAASAIAFNQGEVCTAGSRLLVQNSIAEEFTRVVCKYLSGWQPGHPLDPATKMGAIVDQKQWQIINGLVQSGIDEGAQLRAGGEPLSVIQGGYYMSPVLFDAVTPNMRIVREEIFGPVLSVMTFTDENDAIKQANDTIYGLAAGVWTSHLAKAHRVARSIRAGSVWVNHYDGGDMTAPFGGFKQSGNGRDKSLHAFDKYTEIKSTWFDLRG